MKDAPLTLDQPIPHVCTITDVCRILQISEAQFFVLRKRGQFPIPPIEPPIAKGPRFAGEHVRQYLRGELAPVRVRRVR